MKAKRKKKREHPRAHSGWAEFPPFFIRLSLHTPVPRTRGDHRGALWFSIRTHCPKSQKKKEVSMKSFSTQVANQIFNERINKNGVVISIRNTHLAFCSLGEKQLTCQNAAQWIADLCFLFLVYKFCLLLFAVKTGI